MEDNDMTQINWIKFAKENFTKTLDNVDLTEIDRITKRIMKARKIFLYGKGRTGLITEMFAMRLAQLGMQVHLLEQPTTPALSKEDLIILISGSGETNGILSIANRVLDIGAEMVVITKEPNSSLSKLTQDKLIVPVLDDKKENLSSSKVYNGTLFEQALFVILDLMTHRLVVRTGQSYQDLDQRHANLE
jgi:6-phospho-3-hexuloisomerase